MGQGNNLNRAEPVIDFTSLDAADVLADMKAYGQANFSDKWTDFNAGQLGTMLLEAQAYQFDLGTFYMNALINECFVMTALRKNNVLSQGRALDYTPPSVAPATVTLRLTLDPAGTYPVPLLASTHKFSNEDGVIFMPVSDVSITGADAATGYIDVACQEGEFINNEALGSSSGQANQRFTLSQKPVLLDDLVVRVGATVWTRYDAAVDMGASTQGYLVEIDDNDNATIVFGDGEFGQIPTLAQAVTADYRVTDADDGNLGTGTIETIVSAPSVVTAVTNQLPSTGGTPPLTTKQLRVNIPASLRAKNGQINSPEVEAAALQVSGVAKARAVDGDPLIRQVKLYIAPGGGGAPTDVLKNLVQVELRATKMLGLRLSTLDPVYKQLRMSLLVHARSGSRQTDVSQAVIGVLTNTAGSGAFDFAEMNFGGVDSEGNPQASIDALDDLLDDLDSAGVKRVQYLGLDVVPEMRRLQPTNGDGTVTAISTPTNDHKRREWVIRFTSPTTFQVYERIIGRVTGIQDTQLSDDTQTFPSTLVADGFTTLNPDRRNSSTYTVTAATDTSLTTTAGGLFLDTQVGAEYYVQRGPLVASGTVGVAYTALDAAGVGVLQFTVNAGASPWQPGDEVIIDVFPPVGDIILRDDEILELDPSNLTVRVAGGVA